jgi:hypothetical protein
MIIDQKQKNRIPKRRDYAGFVVPPVPMLRENLGHFDYCFFDKISTRISGCEIIFSAKTLLFINKLFKK